ncbi:MAG TPA: AraC family transcriptional regulator [Bacillota bacterium]|nr:AraC family transcriptional regulator [Bacillota bacterium]
MDLLQRMNGALDFIESNITEEIDLEKVAQIACCSANHFQRMFSYITGISLSEYIRRRRLTLAALELQESDVKIIDLAVKYNYDSPDSFTRAFQKMHGITPSCARHLGVELKSYPKMTFYITLKGDVSMNYRIEEKAAFELIGKSIMVNVENVGIKAPEFWKEVHSDGTYEKLQTVTKGKEVYGVTCYLNNIQDGTFSYHIAFQNNSSANENCEFEIIKIPALTWVVFESKGPQPQAIKELWERAYSEWFPSSGYSDLGGPEAEVYYQDKCELWISIKKM